MKKYFSLVMGAAIVACGVFAQEAAEPATQDAVNDPLLKFGRTKPIPPKEASAAPVIAQTDIWVDLAKVDVPRKAQQVPYYRVVPMVSVELREVKEPLRTISLPAEDVFSDVELAEMFRLPDDFDSQPLVRRAKLLDWCDRFAEAYELLKKADRDGGDDAYPARLMLANYYRFGRPGIPEFIDADNPGFYKLELQSKADEILRGVIADIKAGKCSRPDAMTICAYAYMRLSAKTYDEYFEHMSLAEALAGYDITGMKRKSFSVVSDGEEPDSIQYRYQINRRYGGLRRNDDENIAALRRPIMQNLDTDTQLDAGIAYLFGYTDDSEKEFLRMNFLSDIRRDVGKAEFWFRRAAVRGNPQARLALDGDKWDETRANYILRCDYLLHQDKCIDSCRLPGALGFGLAGRFLPYDADDVLKLVMDDYGFKAYWFERGDFGKDEPKRIYGDRTIYQRWQSDESDPPSEQKMPFLLYAPAVADASQPVPLVVYLPGNGEYGTDLKKQFRQTKVMDVVTSPEFQAKHPCYLMIVMLPDHSDGNVVNYPQAYVDPRAEFVADIIEHLSNTLDAPKIDRSRLYMTGLGSGANQALSLALAYPGRVAASANAMMRLIEGDGLNPERPGFWWICNWPGGPFDESYDTKGEEWRIERVTQSKKIRKFAADHGGEFKVDIVGDTSDSWWDRFWDRAEVWEWMFSKKSEGEVW